MVIYHEKLLQRITIGIFITLNLPWNDAKLLQYNSKLPWYFNPRNIMVFLLQYFTMKNYRNSFITLAPGASGGNQTLDLGITSQILDFCAKVFSLNALDIHHFQSKDAFTCAITECYYRSAFFPLAELTLTIENASKCQKTVSASFFI
jgi:hypothetical protein